MDIKISRINIPTTLPTSFRLVIREPGSTKFEALPEVLFQSSPLLKAGTDNAIGKRKSLALVDLEPNGFPPPPK